MITLISGTDRKHSMTLKVANKTMDLLGPLTDEPIQLITLENLSLNQTEGNPYETPSEHLKELVNTHLIKAKKMIFIIPEYNGSFPGILKLFVDLASTINYQQLFNGKKVLLIGVAEGKGGNLVGLNHFASIIQHMNGKLVTRNIPISLIKQQFLESGELNGKTKSIIVSGISKFLVE